MKNQSISRQTVGKRLKKLRNENGKKTAEVAKACGCTAQAILSYERGTRVPKDKVKIKLANYYDVTIQDLFFTKNQEIDGIYSIREDD